MSDISFDVEEGYYLSPFTAKMILSNRVQNLQFSVNGAPPAISKYIAYDTLNPPNPFIAVTQDGRGNVVYDGGFPKFYNDKAPVASITGSITMEFAATCQGVPAGTNAYYYSAFTDKQVTIAIGDTLVYDMFQNSADARVGIDAITASPPGSATYSLRDWGLSSSGGTRVLRDQNGLEAHPRTDLGNRAVNQWYHREIDLSPCAGHTFITWSMAYEGETAGVFSTRFRDVYIVDRNGNIKATLFKDKIDLPGNTPVESGAVGYTNLSKTLYDPRSQLSASFKYLFNAVLWVANPKKVAAGNRKILVLGDAPTGALYSIKDSVNSHGFYTSLSRLFSAVGFTATYKDVGDYSGGYLNPTAAELEQYTCVLLMASRSGTTAWITDEAVDNLVKFREDGNGLIVITDHGVVNSDITQANTPSRGSSFFWTANKLITRFGAYFSGDYNRSPVNVGFLRNTYGDHPLYAGMDNSESIYADVSESRVMVTIYPTVDPEDVPDFQIQNGTTVIHVTATLTTGEIVSHQVTYNVVPFKISFTDGTVIRDNGQTLDIGAKSKVPLSASLIGTLSQNLSGNLYKNGALAGTVSYTPANGMVVNWTITKDGLIDAVDGDKFTVITSAPLAMTSEITIERFQPIITNQREYADVMNRIREFRPSLTDIGRVVSIFEDIRASNPDSDIKHSLSIPLNIRRMDQHFRDLAKNNLANRWLFRDDFLDHVGSNDATPASGVTLTTHLDKKSVRYSGSSGQLVNLGSIDLGSGPWTISTWYCPEDTDDYHHLFSSTDHTTLVFKIAAARDLSSRKVYIHSDGISSIGQEVEIGKWSLLTATYDSGQLKLYINGVLVATHSRTLVLTAETFVAGGNATVSEWSSGWQRDLRVYKRALIQDEIQYLYETT